jgi:uncharacterized membrane protein YccC
LRRASRAALIVPTVFGLCELLAPQPQLITFATFGTFALLVMGDFGGASRARAGAYAATIAVGCVIIFVGTLASTTFWMAALVVAFGGFLLQFVAVFGGYVTAAQLPLLLSLVLAVAIPAAPDQILLRLAGWLIGGTAALLSGVFLWPRHEHERLRQVAAESCRALADLMAAMFRSPDADRDVGAFRQRAQAAVAELRQLYRVTPHRPASPARTDRAFAELVDEVGRALKVLPAAHRRAAPFSEAADSAEALADSVVRVLQDSAVVLTGGSSAPDLATLVARRDAHVQAVSTAAGDELRAGVSADRVHDALEGSRPLKIVSYVTLAIGANATLVAGIDIDQPESLGVFHEIEGASGVSAGARRVVETMRIHMHPRSIWFRNSLRAAVGLSLAVVLVNITGLDHAFWAVLGTLSVLRSNALATGRTALAAVVGTALGILPASLLLIPLGNQTTAVLWMVFPITVFVAAYAPSVVGFIAGQAAFTLLVVVLFNLIQPVGWMLGLVRLQDILFGTALSFIVGALFWPRGARGQLRTALGSLYRGDAEYLRACFGYLLGTTTEDACRLTRQAAVAEAARAGEVFDQFLNDRAAKVLPPSTWAALQAGGSHLLLAGDSLEHLALMGYQVTACEGGAQGLSTAVDALVEALGCVSDSLEHGTPLPASLGSALPEDQLNQASTECLAAWGGMSDPDRRGSALGLISAGDWLHSLGLLIDHLNGPAEAAGRVANLAWWH